MEMDKIYLDDNLLEKSKSFNDSENYLKEKEKFVVSQIMNYLFHEYHSIDLYSTYELERIIIFSNLSKQRTLNLLENYSKEEIMSKIEEAEYKQLQIEKLDTLKKSMSANLENKIYNKKEVYYLIYKNQESESPWSFINSNVNIIDLKDLLNSFDHHKLIKKAQSMVKDKDSKKLNEYFVKYTENRERKFRDIFKANLEQNDLNFLKDDTYFESEVNKRMKKSIMNNVTENLSRDIDKFFLKFTSCSNNIKSHIIEYLDIFSIGKFGMTNKYIYDYVYKKFDIEKVAKNYAMAIFKNLNIYINDQEKLKHLYKNYFSMIKNRPRLRFSGIYYSKVKFFKIGDMPASNGQNMHTVSYFRIYRFFPDGQVYSITTPHIKSNKIWSLILKNEIEMKRGRFYVDENDTLILNLNAGIDKQDIYTFKMTQLSEYPDLKFKGLILQDYTFANGRELVPVKLTEYFPKTFKFRNLDVMKNEFYIKKFLE